MWSQPRPCQQQRYVGGLVLYSFQSTRKLTHPLPAWSQPQTVPAADEGSVVTLTTELDSQVDSGSTSSSNVELPLVDISLFPSDQVCVFCCSERGSIECRWRCHGLARTTVCELAPC